jgi:tight adherence protein B
MFMPEYGKRILIGQGLAALAIIALEVAVGIPLWPVWLVGVGALPLVHLTRARQRRVTRIEDQIDGFIVSLANSLKAVPSPAAALEATTMTIQDPMKQEIEHVLGEMRIGSTLEQALIAMSARLRNRTIDVAFSAVLIGLRVGGNLPVTLERTAATIREMNRLLGVVRTKTGEGRAQLWVLALFPLGAVGAFNFVQPGYFDPFQHTIVGQIAVGVAVLLWIAALLIARKVLAVDI